MGIRLLIVRGECDSAAEARDLVRGVMEEAREESRAIEIEPVPVELAGDQVPDRPRPTLRTAIRWTIPDTGTIVWRELLRTVTVLVRPVDVTPDEVEAVCQVLVMEGVLKEVLPSTYERVQA